jgi:hypothetical protein
MNRKTCLVLLALALPLLSACEPRENCAQAYNDRTYRLRICTDKREYDFGAPISITFTVTNFSDETLVLNGGGKPAMDIRVEDEYWSDEQEMTPELTRITLPPDGSHTITWVWPTSRTDLEALGHDFGELRLITISVFGIEFPIPGAEGLIGLLVYYRAP